MNDPLRPPEIEAVPPSELENKHMIEKMSVLRWKLADVAESLHLTEGEIREYFTDGRRVSFILERRICRELIGGQLSPSEGVPLQDA